MKISTITCINLTKRYKINLSETSVLNKFSYEFIQGRSYAITGPSGSGKSTLIHLLAGLEKPSDGNIIHLHDQVYGVMLQTPLLINELSVLENIALPGLVAGLDFDESIQRAQELIVLIELETHAHMNPWQLSGGQQQRVALARALFFSPTFLIADEPTAHLDPENAKNITSLMISLSKKYTIGLIIASHDLQLINSLENIIIIRSQLNEIH